jgi:predicted ester cyclase
VEDLIAEVDKVAYRITYRGTHRGDFMGIRPTGKQVSFTGIAIDRFKDGKFVESWFNLDALGLMQQLGAIPQMAQARA